MRLISIEQAARQARASLVRFPLVLLSAVVAAAAAMVVIGRPTNDEPAIRVLIAALLGIPLFTAVAVQGERARPNALPRWVTPAAAVLLLVAFWMATGRWTETMQATRFAHLAVAFHAMVAVAPFARATLPHAFWQYNRLLFQRFLIATLFTAVLFGGLAIALVAIDQLFDVRIDEKWYVRLWIFIALVVHPWFFLGGVPRDLESLESRDDYPAGLKVFAQLILLPVVTVYLVILTVYLLRVVVTRTWPSGWIGYLVSSVSAAGTLALLLVHPIRERADSRWVDAYGRWFYVAMLPSIGMLVMAIWLRVDQYGFTERRFFLAALTVWLAGIALYYARTGSRNIRIIPATLALVAVVTFVGPWSAYAVSLRSQRSRLRDLLARNEILVQSQVRRASRPVPFEQRAQMSSVVRYLLDMHGAPSLAAISGDLRRAAERPQTASNRGRQSGGDHPQAQAVLEALGVPYVSRWESRPSEHISYFAEASEEPVSVEAYDWMARANLVTSFSIPLGADTLRFAADTQPARSVVSLRGRTLLEIPLWQLLDRARQALQSGDSLPSSPSAGVPGPSRRLPIVLDLEGGDLRLRLLAGSVSGRGTGPAAQVRGADATILLRLTRRQ